MSVRKRQTIQQPTKNWVKSLNKHFPREDIQATKAYKKCSILLAISEIANQSCNEKLLHMNLNG